MREKTKVIEFTNSEIARMRESLLHQRDCLESGQNLKKSGITAIDEIICYNNESRDKEIDEINYICSKLG